MFKIEGDYSNIQVYTSQDYMNGAPALKMSVSLAPELRSKIEKFEKMEKEWQEVKKVLEENVELINNNPAVNEAFKNFQTLLALAKDHNATKL